MRILALADFYPDPYKSYYDTQFASLVEHGHELRILASSQTQPELNEKVVQYGLGRRTAHYPTLLRQAERYVPPIASAALRRPAWLAAAVAGVRGRGAGRHTPLLVARALMAREAAPDFILVQGLAAAMDFAFLRRMMPDVPVAMYYHGGEIPFTSPWQRAAMAAGFDFADLVFTNSRSAAENAIGRGCPPDRVRIAPVGFMLADFEPPEPRAYRPDGVLRLLSAGRMSEEKGHIHALRALKQLVDAGVTDVHYSLTGRGAMLPGLRQFVEESGLGAYVTFLGQLSTAGVVRAMGEADVLIQPSIQLRGWAENQACAVQEAMLMKALVITTRSGGVSECIPPEMQPYCVQPGDPSALADAIDRVRRLPDERVRALGETVRGYVREHFDIAALNRAMLEETVAARRGGGMRANPARGAMEQPAPRARHAF